MSDNNAFSSEEDLRQYIEGELERLETVTPHQPEPEDEHDTLGGKPVTDYKKRRRQQIRAALRSYDEDDDLYLDME